MNYLVNFIEEEEKEGLQLNPDFQRGNVWTEHQQTAYIEFLLKGGKSARILYFNNPSWHLNVSDGAYNDFVCVDGLQRITAIQRFIKNEIQVFGSYYKEFTDCIGITQSVKVNINDLKSKREVLQWYLDMNAGGTVHSDSEIKKVQKMISELNEI